MARLIFSIAAFASARASDVIDAAPHASVAALAFEGIRSEAAIAESPCGPGWFDSSWDLRLGLDVLEGLPEHPSLDEWLEFSLRS